MKVQSTSWKIYHQSIAGTTASLGSLFLKYTHLFALLAICYFDHHISCIYPHTCASFLYAFFIAPRGVAYEIICCNHP